MQQEMNKRECLACQKKLHGRSDKKFCDDYCRNVFNNGSKTSFVPIVRKINGILMRNRRLILELLGEKQTLRIRRDQLLDAGFRFQHYTHQLRSQKGSGYFFCYDAGYLPLEDNWCLLVKQNMRKNQENNSLTA